MSYDAIRWAMEQALESAMTKFVLVVMADCVNADGGEMACWPSYAFIARRTGMNIKTVEASVYRLRQEGFIVDTGRRAGDTGKVVVYRLNATESGAIKPGPQSSYANGTRPQNDPITGVIGVIGNPPNFDANPPKNDAQSPQKVGLMTPKQGVRTRNGTRKEPGTEPGIRGAVAPSIPGVPVDLVDDWVKVRKAKHAGPITDTVVAGLIREAGKAGVTVEGAVRYCCEAGWQNFTASFYAKREGLAAPLKTATRHSGFGTKDYRQGVTEDGLL